MCTQKTIVYDKIEVFSHVCVMYLSDTKSAIDLNRFYDALMCQVHLYCKYVVFFVCVDFKNSK